MNHPEVSRRVELKQAIAGTKLASTSIAVAGGFACYGGAGAYVNRACALASDRAISDDEVDVIVAFFDARGEEAHVELSPYEHPSLVQALGRRGFHVKHLLNVLARVLDPSDAPAATSLPEGIAIELLDKTDASMVKAYVETAERGFAPEGQALSPIAIALTTRSVLTPSVDCFVARTALGEIVGTAGAESSDRLTSLFGATVVPGWRGRGIQRALLAARVERGRADGADLAAVMASPGSTTERNAIRLGFQMAYTRVAFRRPRTTTEGKATA